MYIYRLVCVVNDMTQTRSWLKLNQSKISWKYLALKRSVPWGDRPGHSSRAWDRNRVEDHAAVVTGGHRQRGTEVSGYLCCALNGSLNPDMCGTVISHSLHTLWIRTYNTFFPDSHTDTKRFFSPAFISVILVCSRIVIFCSDDQTASE